MLKAPFLVIQETWGAGMRMGHYKRKHMVIGSKYLWGSLAFLMLMGLAACGKDFSRPKKGKKPTVDSQGATVTDASPSGAALSPGQAQTLAIGQQVITNLAKDLTAAGLTEDQTKIIISSADVELQSRAGALALPSLTLNQSNELAQDPVHVSLPAVIAGALAGLDAPAAGLSELQRRVQLTKTIIGSVFSSLNGNIDQKADEWITALTRTMIAQAMTKLPQAGLREEYAANAAQAVTEGAVGALRNAGMAGETLVKASRSVVSSTVENLAASDWGSQAPRAREVLGEAVAKTAQGAVASLASLGISAADASKLAGQLTADSLVGLASLQKTRPDVSPDLELTVKKTAKGAVAGLAQAQLTNESTFNAALNQITTASVGVLEGLGFEKSKLAQGVAAVAIGSLGGVASHQLSDSDVNKRGVMQELMASSVKSLASVKLDALERAQAAADIVSATLAALNELGLRSEESKAQAVEKAVAGSVASLGQAGIREQGALAVAVQQVARQVTAALPAAGLSAETMTTSSASVAKTAITQLAQASLSSDASGFASLSAKVTQGVMEGVASLYQQGNLAAAAVATTTSNVVNAAVAGIDAVKATSSVNLGVNEVASVAVDVSRSAFTGLATGGVAATTIQTASTQVISQLDTQLRSLGVATTAVSSATSAVSSEGTKAASLADSLKEAETSYPLCKDQYPDTSENVAFFAAIAQQADPLFCRTTKDRTCPQPRSNDMMDSHWVLADVSIKSETTPYLCQLQRHPKTKIVAGSFDFVSPKLFWQSAQTSFSWAVASQAIAYQVKVTTDDKCQNIVWQTRTEASSVSIPALAEGAYYLCLAALSLSDSATAATSSPLAFQIDTIANPSVAIQATGTLTNRQVTVLVTASEAAEMYLTNVVGCNSGGSWSSYLASPQAWSLSEGDGAKVVYAQVRSAAGALSDCIASPSVQLDTTPPPDPVLWIANNISSTRLATVSLTITAAGASDAYVTTTAGCSSGGSWVPLAQNQQWTFTPSQENSAVTLYAKVRDEHGNASGCVSDSIIHDNTPPSMPNTFDDGDFAGSSHSPPLFSWPAASDSGSGVYEYQVAIGTAAGLHNVLGWQGVGTVTTLTASSLATAAFDTAMVPGQTYYASVRACDQAGNCSTPSLGDGFFFGWRLTNYIKAPSVSADDLFGQYVALNSSGELLAVGALQEDSSQTTISYGTSVSTDDDAVNSGAVYIYKRNAMSWDQEAFLKASQSDNNFGGAVSFSGDTLAVAALSGKYGASTIVYGTSLGTAGDGTGSVYIFQRQGTSWSQQAMLKAPNPAIGNVFGRSVVFSGDTLIIGSPNEDSGASSVTNGTTMPAPGTSVNESGAAYIFRRSATTWAQEAYLKGPTPQEVSYFGMDVALSGDIAAVAAYLEDSTATVINRTVMASSEDGYNSGSVYIFKRTNTTWAVEAKLKASNSYNNIQYGSALALDQRTLAVTAYEEGTNTWTVTNGPIAPALPNPPSTGTGAVYVYKQNGSSWTQEAHIKSASPYTQHHGWSLALENDRLVASADRDGTAGTTIIYGNAQVTYTTLGYSWGGIAFIYDRMGSSWQQTAMLKPPVMYQDLKFGGSVALANGVIAVGAHGDKNDSTTITNGVVPSIGTDKSNAGSVFIFRNK